MEYKGVYYSPDLNGSRTDYCDEHYTTFLNDQAKQGWSLFSVVRLSKDLPGKEFGLTFNAEQLLITFVRPRGPGGDVLRFTIGTKVECLVGDEWKNGKIIDLGYRDEFGHHAPYQIELNDGSLVYAPIDDDLVATRQQRAARSPRSISQPEKIALLYSKNGSLSHAPTMNDLIDFEDTADKLSAVELNVEVPPPQLFQGDCMGIMANIPDASVDLILNDPPYGVTSCDWDVVLDLDDMWLYYERILTYNGQVVLFAQAPFTSKLIESSHGRGWKYYTLVFEKYNMMRRTAL